MKIGRNIDHIVYAVPDLEEAIDQLEKRLGVRPQFGGRHTTKGTKNALLNLGNACYLEILAVDESNTDIFAPRWMGIDLIETSKITRWSIKSDQLTQDQAILQSYQKELGEIQKGQRKLSNGKLIQWEMILPLAEPEVDILPFMTDWTYSSIHPTDSLPQLCELVSIELMHPEPKSIQEYLEKLNLSMTISQDQNPIIRISIQTPNGIVSL